jgi:hypothetical protein
MMPFSYLKAMWKGLERRNIERAVKISEKGRRRRVKPKSEDDKQSFEAPARMVRTIYRYGRFFLLNTGCIPYGSERSGI